MMVGTLLHAIRTFSWDDCHKDVRLSLRLLGKNPGRTFLLVATLALGLGMSSAGFSILRSVLLRPLPFQDPGSLVVLHQAVRSEPGGVSYPHFRDWRQSAKSFSAMAVFSGGESTVMTGDRSERLPGATVSAGLFSLLGVQPVRGRLFRPEDDRLGGGENGERPVLVSESFWRRRMLAREDVIGQHVTVDGLQFQVVGVIPASRAFPIAAQPPEFWTTVAVDAEPTVYGGSIPESRGYPAYDGVLARLRPGVSITDATAEMDRLAALIERAHPKATSMNRVLVRPALNDLVGNTRPVLFTLYGAVVCVLLVACANVATLLLVTSLARRREFGIRSALGASSIRLLRQVLMENSLLSLCGGVAGLVLGEVLVQVCVLAAPAGTPRLSDIHLDGTVLLYSLGVALLAGPLISLTPAILGLRRDIQEDLRDHGVTAHRSRGTTLAGGLLIAGQIAVCMVLTCAAALLVNSFVRILNVPRGFDPSSIVTASVSLPPSQYTQGSDAVRNYYRSFLKELKASPLVVDAAIAERLPLSGSGNSTTVRVVGQSESGLPSTDLRFVDPSYRDALRIPLVSGRFFNGLDDKAHPPVAVVNGAFVRRFLKDKKAEGALLDLGWGGKGPKRVIGVVADLKNQALDLQAKPEVYIPAEQFPNNAMSLLVRAHAGTPDVAALLQQVSRKLDKGVPLERVRTLNDYLLLSAGTQRFLLSLFAVFASSTLLIAAVGIYGILSFAAARRNQEFGIRMALGSRPSQLLALILKQGFALALVGVGTGLLLSVPATSFLSRWLYETAPLDEPSLAIAGTIIVVAALAASYIPARRASRVDPMVVLRAE